jgi:hypothetical protein
MLFLKQAHLLDWQGGFALHEQDINPCPPDFFFNKFSIFILSI